MIFVFTKPLESFTAVALITLADPAAAGNVKTVEDVIKDLPTTNKVTLVNGNKVDVTLTWATDSYKNDEAGTYTFKDTLVTPLPTSVNNNGSVAAPTVEVTVAP